MSFNNKTNLLINSESNTDCEGLSLIQASKCLNDEVKGFFKYNISNVNKELSLEELKVQGGVCNHWSEYYLNRFKELGFLGKEVIFWSKNKDKGHEIALVWDNNISSYCILDQTNIIGCGIWKEYNEN